MSPSNSLIDWIIRNRADYIAQGLQGSSAFANQVEFEGNTINDLAQNSSIDQVDQDELNTSLALNPLLQNWFSVQKPTSFVSCKYEVFKMLFFNHIFNFSFFKSAYCNFFTGKKFLSFKSISKSLLLRNSATN